MKVYVIEKGEYSNRHIVGVTLTMAEAEEVKEAIKDSWDTMEITEYDTDQFKTNLFRYAVTLHFDEPTVEYDEYDYYDEYKTSQHIAELMYIVYAKTQEQALKIARDMDAKRKAEKAGIT